MMVLEGHSRVAGRRMRDKMSGMISWLRIMVVEILQNSHEATHSPPLMEFSPRASQDTQDFEAFLEQEFCP